MYVAAKSVGELHPEEGISWPSVVGLARESGANRNARGAERSQ
jgi:hypothetical protein